MCIPDQIEVDEPLPEVEPSDGYKVIANEGAIHAEKRAWAEAEDSRRNRFPGFDGAPFRSK